MSFPCVLTDVGFVSVAGDRPAALFERLLGAGSLGKERIPALPIEGFRVRDYVDRRGLKHLSRASQLACAAASRLGAGLAGLAPAEVGVVFGSAWASLDSIVRFEREAEVEGPRFVDPILFTETVANVPAGQISIFFDWSALNATVSAGTASGLEAMIRATRFLEEGRARAVVAGGGDELNRHLLNVLGEEGPVGGEGACLFVIEPEEHASARSATALGALGACASRHAAGLDARAGLLREILSEDGLVPSDVDLVVLSENGDALRESAEATLFRALFGDGSRPARVAPKRILGETWGASGPLGVVVALEAMRRSREVRHALVLDDSPGSHFAALLLHGLA